MVYDLQSGTDLLFLFALCVCVLQLVSRAVQEIHARHAQIPPGVTLRTTDRGRREPAGARRRVARARGEEEEGEAGWGETGRGREVIR